MHLALKPSMDQIKHVFPTLVWFGPVVPEKSGDTDTHTDTWLNMYR